jgi:hypothetical protein
LGAFVDIQIKLLKKDVFLKLLKEHVLLLFSSFSVDPSE